MLNYKAKDGKVSLLDLLNEPYDINSIHTILSPQSYVINQLISYFAIKDGYKALSHMNNGKTEYIVFNIDSIKVLGYKRLKQIYNRANWR